MKIARDLPAKRPTHQRVPHACRDSRACPAACRCQPLAVKIMRSGSSKGDKPIGSFLFSGPTGG